MQNNKERPLSPHLTIYKPQISSIMSISHRATGVLLFLALMLFSWWIFMSAYCSSDVIEAVHNFFTCYVGKAAMFIMFFCLFYHLCNGIRHLFWDIGLGYELKIMHKTGWTVVLAAVALTIFAFNIIY